MTEEIESLIKPPAQDSEDLPGYMGYPIESIPKAEED